MNHHKPKRNGWERYFDCMLYTKDGSVSRAIYLDDRTGWTCDLQPYRIKGRTAICTRCTLRDGYFILVNFKAGYWYSDTGIRDIIYNEEGQPLWQ